MKLALGAVFLVFACLPAVAQNVCTYPGFHQTCKERSEECTFERVCDAAGCRGVRRCAPLSKPVTDCYCTKESE